MNKSSVDTLKVGEKVKFAGERQCYTVQAASKRFAVCTKPFNPKRTVLYTIVDFERWARGADNFIFGKFNYEIQSECAEALKALEAGEMEVSRRNTVALEIEEVR